MELIVTPFFDPESHSFSYVLVDPDTRCCAIIDPVLNYDAEAERPVTRLADQIVAYVKANDLIVEWLLETHVHADHLSAARYLKSRFVCAQLGIGAGVRCVHQQIGGELPEPDQVFDRLFGDDERIHLGRAVGRVLATPGHTPGCVAYVFENLAFVGDAIFMPDYGTGRCDFPGGNPRQLFGSVRRILALPPATRLLMCHDYGPNGRDPEYLSTVAEQRAANIHLGGDTSEPEFVRFRMERDATLDDPALLALAVPFNLAAGTVPLSGGARVAAA